MATPVSWQQLSRLEDARPATIKDAKKLLKVTGQDHVAAVTYGIGAIGQATPRTANSYLPEFENELREAKMGRLSVEDFATKLGEFFDSQWQIAGMPTADVEPMIFLIGGYDEGAPHGRRP